ncbi:peptidase S41 [Gemmatirosa kalamazoonensis]|uniref:Peptidase S41 n=1 Tax=Gemmatirosa kalamazoonensis TaxID=861299 RepID=W0RND1_9BACT|nr:S41 family peptidase [Gemmatirosa kalamazoonensis]AHG92007.1 peptidase S41 [Gemmatirosa kalamazoonensis]
MLHVAPLLALLALAERQPTPSCTAQLAWTTAFAARNYAGFDDKVTAARRPAYDALLDTLRASSARAATSADCDAVLRRWTAFFGDGHLGFTRRAAAPASPAASPSDDEVRARYASWEQRALDEPTARARLTASGARRDAAEGVWESLDGRYRVAALRDATSGDVVMTVLAADSVWWMPGQVKARLARDTGGVYAARFYMRDHSEQRWTARVVGNVLTFSGGGTWVRRWPVGAGDRTPEQLRASLNTRFAARELWPGTVLVQIPTFNDPRGIDSLFAAEGARIRAAERLVVDVRGNGGGSDYNYRELLPLVYTGPIKVVGMMALATDDNIRANEALAADTTFPEGQRAGLRANVARMKASRGGWWIGNDGETTFDSVRTLPRRVAILVDRGCASSCEQFLLAARQSAKVTLYGERSAGILDYANVRRAEMPGGDLVLNYPTTKSKRVAAGQGIDGVGIAPQVRIPVAEWEAIEWVRREIERGRP